MQEFHKLLTRFINEKNTTIYTLAKNTGIERSYIQKMKSGARIPGEKSTILKLAKGLMLTANESAQLVQAYSIAKMGEGKYYQRMFVQNIISSFAKIHVIVNYALYIAGPHTDSRLAAWICPSDQTAPTGCYSDIGKAHYSGALFLVGILQCQNEILG